MPSRATGASTESTVRLRHTRSVHAAPAVHHPLFARLWSLMSRDEPADIRHHQDELPGTAGACKARSARGPVAVSPTIARRPRGVRALARRGITFRLDHSVKRPGAMLASPASRAARLGPVRSSASTGAGSLPARFYRRRAVPSTCVATGTTIGIGATHILRSCSISNPAASIAAGVSRAVWQPPNAVGQNVRSTKC